MSRYRLESVDPGRAVFEVRLADGTCAGVVAKRELTPYRGDPELERYRRRAVWIGRPGVDRTWVLEGGPDIRDPRFVLAGRCDVVARELERRAPFVP